MRCNANAVQFTDWNGKVFVHRTATKCSSGRRQQLFRILIAPRLFSVQVLDASSTICIRIKEERSIDGTKRRTGHKNNLENRRKKYMKFALHIYMAGC